MAKAPTEKHLEQWIVNNFLYFGLKTEYSGRIPDYRDPSIYYASDTIRYEMFGSEIIGRQVQLPNGIADLMLVHEIASLRGNVQAHNIKVVELKKHEITYKALGQCARYLHDLRNIYSHLRRQAIDSGYSEYFYEKPDWSGTSMATREIQGLLIGHGYEDENLLIAAKTVGVTVIHYDYDPEANAYSFHEIEADGDVDGKTAARYAYTETGEWMFKVMETYASNWGETK